jgi:ketosteroid isomerase-like protein
MRFLIRLVGLTCILAACDQESTPTDPTSPRPAFLVQEGEEASSAALLDLRLVRDELLATDRSYAAAGASTNLVDALVAPLADNGVFLAPGPGFLQGPDAVREALLANPINALSKWRWDTIRVDVSSDGTQGYTYGYTEFELPDGTILPGKYLAYWARQTGGDWKMAAYRRLPRAPGAVSLTPPPGFETPTTMHRRYFPKTEPPAEIQTLNATDLAFSGLAQIVTIAEAFVHYASSDAAHSGGPVAWAFGADEIAAAHAGEPAGLFNWAPAIADVAGSGDLGSPSETCFRRV